MENNLIRIGNFDVSKRMDHYLIFKNGSFIESCDCAELYQTLEDLKNDLLHTESA